MLGAIYSTVWYGSDPVGHTPTVDKPLVDLPSIVKCTVVAGRLVADGTPRSDDLNAAQLKMRL